MKPKKDPFYTRRKQARDGLQVLVRSALVRAHGNWNPGSAVQIYLGRKPGAMKTRSSATFTDLCHICVPRDWRWRVHDKDLEVLDGYLCLHAQRAPKPAGADECWRVLLFAPVSGHTCYKMAVRFAGVTKIEDQADRAYRLCLDVFRRALLEDQR